MRRLWEAWKRFGRRVADVQARFLLIFFYFVILSPFALLVRWRSDPLTIKRGSATGWRPRKDAESDSRQRAASQF